jgi:hypothetical protein
LRFDIFVENSGLDDLVVGRPQDHPEWFDYSNAHGHYHFRDFNMYTLFNAAGEKVVDGQKQAFCIEDSVRMSSSADANPYFTCDYQGISAGWADLYNSRLPGQYVVIDGVRDGNYTLQVTTDYGGMFAETNEDDNTIEIGLSIRGNRVTVTDPAHIVSQPSDFDFA